MKNKLEAYLAKHPEIVFEWNDEHTDAKGWLVINSLKGGAAGGGTRMRKGLTKKEVVSLAKVMEIKFSVCGPSIGGAKSGIDFDPWDPRKTEVLERWYKAIRPLLKFYYGTGGVWRGKGRVVKTNSSDVRGSSDHRERIVASAWAISPLACPALAPAIGACILSSLPAKWCTVRQILGLE